MTWDMGLSGSASSSSSFSDLFAGTAARKSAETVSVVFINIKAAQQA